jgi:hypothetical protein
MPTLGQRQTRASQQCRLVLRWAAMLPRAHGRTQRPCHPALARASGPRAACGRLISSRKTRSTLGKNYCLWILMDFLLCGARRATKTASQAPATQLWGAPILILQALIRECTHTLLAVLTFAHLLLGSFPSNSCSMLVRVPAIHTKLIRSYS